MEQKKLISCKYVLKQNILSYEFPDGFDENYDLIIDPTLIFSSFSGSFANNFGYSATFDSKGFLYSGSSVFGQQYPTTYGAYDTIFGGGTVDIAISKFDTTGTFMVYSTYIGGNEDELPHSLIVNSFDELYIMGTTSSTDFPTTIDCYDSSFNGGSAVFMNNGLGVNYNNGSDIFITHLNSDGSSLLGSTYIGGSDNDGLNSTNEEPTENILRYNYADEVRGEIEIDANNNIYIGSCTRSLDFPTSNNTFQPSYGGGDLDGCIFKFDNSLKNLIWSSFLGGEEHDAIYSIALDDSLNMFCSGGTNSTLFPVSQNAYQNTFQGGRSDGFITHITSNGQQKISSTYYGSNEYDQIFFIDLDRQNNCYLFGQTEIQDSSFIENAQWSVPGSGQFVSKIYYDLTDRYYSTVFGSGNGINISPTAFLVDLCNKMYLAGWGGAVNNLGILDNNAGYTNDMPISSDAFQGTTSDSSDFYIMVIEDDASGFVYGSYFGGDLSSEHVDGGTSRFDRKGKIYQAICAGCGGNSDLPTEPSGVVSPINNSSCNLGVFKMEFELPYVLADFEPPSLGCAPITHNFVNTSVFQSSSNFTWNFGDGNESNEVNPSHTFQEAGNYQVQLIVDDNATCNFSDTISKTVLVIGDTSYSLPEITICQGESQQIGFLPNPDTSFSYSWYPEDGISNISSSNPFANPTQSTSYYLMISNGICIDTAFQAVYVNSPIVAVPNYEVLCDHNNIINLEANSFGTAQGFTWSSNNNFSDTINSGINDSIIEISPNQSTWYYIKIVNNGCSYIDSSFVNVPIGSIDIIGDSILCWGDTLLLSANADQNQESINFEFSPDSLAISSPFNDAVFFQLFTDQYITLDAIDSVTNCKLVDSIFIVIDTLPISSINVTADYIVIAPGNTTQLHVNPNNYQYEWEPIATLNNPSFQHPLANPLITTTYTVNVKSGKCINSDSITIEVNELTCGEPDIFIPNAFSPNNDDNNDQFKVRGNYISDENFEFKVFDRLGNLIFKTNSPNDGWNGNYTDTEKPCDPGVFVYYLNMECLDGQSYFKKGNVTLLK
jgi:gliding motility-associated-like protein